MNFPTIAAAVSVRFRASRTRFLAALFGAALGAGAANGAEGSHHSTQAESQVTVEIVFQWTGSVSNDWNTAANWLPMFVPGVNDIVLLDNGGHIDSAVGQTVRGLRLLQGTLGNYSVTVTGGAGTSVWRGGSIGQSLLVAPGAYLAIDTSGQPYLDGATLANAGVINISASDFNDPRQMLGNGGAIQNLSGGRIEVDRDGLIMLNVGTAPLIYNQAGAVFVKTATAGGRSTVNWRLRNDGTVGADAGALTFNNGGSSSGNAGTFHAAAAAARLEFDGGTHTFVAGARFTGPGRSRLVSGTLTLNADVSIGQSGQPAGGFEQTGGYLGGFGNLSMVGGSGSYVWIGGELNTGLFLGVGTTSTIDTIFQPYLNGGTVINSGLVTIIAGDPNNPQQMLGNGGSIINQSGGRIEVARDGQFMLNVGAAPLIDNRAGAVFVKTSAAGGHSFTSWRMVNDGTLGADAGTLSFTNGGPEVGSAGVFHLSTAAARLQFNGGTHTLQHGVRFTGPGRARLVSGILLLDGAVDIGHSGQPAGGFEHTGGALRGVGSTGNLRTFGGSGTYVWSGGELNCKLSLSAGTTTIIDTTNQPSLFGGTVTNVGLITIVASDPNNPQYFLGNGGTIVNQGRIEVARDGNFMLNVGTAPLIENQPGAVFVKTAAASGVSFTSWRMVNNGLLGADAGTLSFRNGGPAAGSGGTFVLSTAEARLEFHGGTHTLKAGAAFTGPGRAQLASGLLLLEGTATIGVSGQAAGGFEHLGGAITGKGSLIMMGGSGSYVWSGGELNTSLTLGVGTTTTIDTANQPSLFGGTLTNAGTITIGASDPNTPQYFLGNVGTINNQAGGRIEIARDGLVLLNVGEPPTIENAVGAIFVKTGAAAGRSLINWVLNNEGTVSADAGTLAFDRGSSALGGGGVFSAASAAARVEFAAGTFVLEAGTRFSGPGLVKLTGGVLSLSGAVACGTLLAPAGGFEHSGGSLSGAGSLNLVGATGNYGWSGGSISAVVTLDPAITMVVDTTGQPFLDAGTIVNAGRILLGASDPNNVQSVIGNAAVIVNRPGGRIEHASDGLIFQNIGTPPIVTNFGTIAKIAGAGTSTFGTFALLQRGTLSALPNTVLRFIGSTTFDAPSQVTSGKILFDGPAPALQSAVTISAGATLESNVGLVGAVDGGGNPLGSLQGPGAFRWKAGEISGMLNLAALLRWEIDTVGNPTVNHATINHAGTASVFGGSGSLSGSDSALNIAAGALFQVRSALNLLNFGSAPVIVNAGTFKIGGPAAKVISAWTYTQTGTGTLDLEIGGPNAAPPQFSQFQLTTTVTLAGALKVTFTNGYSPALGTTFPVLTFAARSGSFASTVGLGLHNGLKLAVAQTATSLNLDTIKSSFGDWQDLKFGANAGNPAIAGPDATPAGDGIPNALKYALNIDPFVVGSSKLPRAAMLEDPITHALHLGLTFRRLIGVSDPLYVPRVSSGLTTAWDESGLQVEQFGPAVPVGDGVTETVAFRLKTPIEPASHKFMDLLVEYD